MGLLTGWTDVGRSERASKGKRFERSSSRLIKYLNSLGIILFRIDLSFNFESGDPSQSGVYCNGDALVLTAAENLIVAVMVAVVRFLSRAGLGPQAELRRN
jgi:hypothetical protein